MKFSIITSCYNREATIRGAIRSVMAQTHPEIEYIVVDGASTDGSLEIIRQEERKAQSDSFRKAHPGFTMKVISEPDSGMYEAINKGIRAATGDIVALVHSDDEMYATDTVERVAKDIELSGCDFLYADGLFVNAEDTSKVIRNWIGGRYTRRKVRHGWLPLHPTCYIRRDVMLRLGLYNETYRIAADTDLLVRYLLGGHLTVCYHPHYVVRMRMGGMSTDAAKRRRMWNEDIRVYRSHGFYPPIVTKVEKMLWKIPQFVTAKMKRVKS